MFCSRRSKRILFGQTWSKQRILWSCRWKHISRCRNISSLVSKHRCFGRAGRNVSRSVELARNLDVSVAPVKTYLAWSNLVETEMFYSRRLKRISLGQTWSKPRCFGRAGQNVSHLIELARNLDFTGRAGRNISRLVELGQNINTLVARSKCISLGRMWSKPRYFGHAGRNVFFWSNLVKTKSLVVMPAEKYLALSKQILLDRTWSKHRCFDRAGWNVSRLVKLGPNLDVLVAPVKTYLTWLNLVET